MALTKNTERLDGLKDRPGALFIPEELSPGAPPDGTEGRPHPGAGAASGGPHSAPSAGPVT